MTTEIDVGQLLSRFAQHGFMLIPHTRAACTDLFIRIDNAGFVHCEWTRDDGDYFVIFEKLKDKERHVSYSIEDGNCSLLIHEDNISRRIIFENQEELLSHLFGNFI